RAPSRRQAHAQLPAARINVLGDAVVALAAIFAAGVVPLHVALVPAQVRLRFPLLDRRGDLPHRPAEAAVDFSAPDAFVPLESGPSAVRALAGRIEQLPPLLGAMFEKPSDAERAHPR